MNFSFRSNIETLLYVASGICVAIALGILIMPQVAKQGSSFAGNIIESREIEALVPEKTPEVTPERISTPVKIDTELTTEGEKASDPSLPKNSIDLAREGSEALEKGNGNKALDLFLQAREAGDTSADLQAKIASAYNTTRNFDQAALSAQEILKTSPNNSKARLVLAEARMHQAGATENAALLDEVFTLLSPMTNEPKAQFFLCLVSTYQNNTDSQEKYCLEAKTAENTDARIASDILAQRDLFSTFRDGNRSYIDLLYAKALADAGFYDLSSVMARKIVEQHREYRDAWVVLGYNYLVMEKYALAQVALETAYGLDKTKAHIQYLLGIAYDKGQVKDKAVNYYTLALDNQYPNKTALRQRIALLLVDLQKFDLALKQYVALVSENSLAAPEMYVTPIWLSLDFVKDTQTAWELARKAKEKFPDSNVSDNLLGWVAMAQGRMQDAEIYLQDSIQKNANYDAPWYNLGRVYEATGRIDNAKEAYMKAYSVGKTSQIARLSAESFNRLEMTSDTPSEN